MAKKSILEEFFEMLVEIASNFWQVGVVITTIFSGFTLILTHWAIQTTSVDESSAVMTRAIIEKFSILYYSIPLISLIFTLILASVTYVAFKNSKNI